MPTGTIDFPPESPTAMYVICFALVSFIPYFVCTLCQAKNSTATLRVFRGHSPASLEPRVNISESLVVPRSPYLFFGNCEPAVSENLHRFCNVTSTSASQTRSYR